VTRCSTSIVALLAELRQDPAKALLKAKTTKGISHAQATRWSADADRIGALAGC
jgi:hypothetical protein